ncbi:MAG: MoaD/ThiS family protein [Rubripirellula sp.]
MPHIEFTSQLAQHVECPADQTVNASSLAEAFELVFTQYPDMRSYVMTEEGVLRQHIAVFIDGEMLANRDKLEVPVGEKSEIFVMQALSGG